MKTSALEREISLERLLMTPERMKFQETHLAFYGIYDDLGLESLIPVGDHFDIPTLNKISEKINMLSLRARFSGQRNAKQYLCWLKKEEADNINALCKSNDFIEAKETLLTNAIFV